jgi:hypothetical protein
VTAPPVYGSEVAVALASATKLYVGIAVEEDEESSAGVVTVLNVDDHPDIAEFCQESTELTPGATVTLEGIPVITPSLFVMVV